MVEKCVFILGLVARNNHHLAYNPESCTYLPFSLRHSFILRVIKGTVSSSYSLIMPITRICSLFELKKFLVNDKIRASSQTIKYVF